MNILTNNKLCCMITKNDSNKQPKYITGDIPVTSYTINLSKSLNTIIKLRLKN